MAEISNFSTIEVIFCMELFSFVSCLFLRENYARSWAFPAFAAFSLRAQKLNQQSAVTYDKGNREERAPRTL